jgi:diaminopimelate decarboxylase
MAQNLVEQFGSPLYAYDQKTLENRIEKLQNMLTVPNKILYAMKANYNPTLLKIIINKGLGIDTVSINEIKLALACGCNPENILFTESNASDEQIDEAIKLGVIVNCGSLSRLEKLGVKYGGSIKIFCRVTTQTGGGHHDKTSTYGLGSKFGIYWEQKDEIQNIVEKYSMKLIGLHQHIGSGIYDIATFEKVIDPLLEFAKNFDNLEYLDFGGGFATRYKPEEQELDIKDLGKFMDSKIETFNQNRQTIGKSQIIIMIEPGRYVVNDCGILLTRVTTLKQNSVKAFAGVDTGFNQLIRYAMYGSYHHILNLSKLTGEMKTYDIAGNVCESSDFLAKEREITQISEGDILGILSAGAYGISMASNYNLQPLPTEVLIQTDSTFKLIRSRQTFEDLTNNFIF